MKKSTNKLENEDAQTLFEPIAKKFLKERDVAEKKMFGTTALTIKGKVFVFPWKGRVVFKLPKERVEEIIASKKGIYFDPGHGRISKEWVAINPNTDSECINLAKEAKNFVGKK